MQLCLSAAENFTDVSVHVAFTNQYRQFQQKWKILITDSLNLKKQMQSEIASVLRHFCTINYKVLEIKFRRYSAMFKRTTINQTKSNKKPKAKDTV